METKNINTQETEAVQETEQTKSFTQEQVNSIVQKRLKDKEAEIKEAQAKTTEIDSLRAKAEQYDKLKVELDIATQEKQLIDLGVNPKFIKQAVKMLDPSKDTITQVKEEILTIPSFSNIPETSNVNHLGVKGEMKQEKQNNTKPIFKGPKIGFPE